VLGLARRSNGVIVTNREDQVKLDAYEGISQLSLIPIGSNISPSPPPDFDRDKWRAKWGVKPDETLLAYFGFLNQSKGGKDLIRTCQYLKDKPVKLMMIGGRTGSSDPTNNAYAKDIDELIVASGLDTRVFWTGYCRTVEVSANLMAADICLFPYRDGVSFRRGSLMAALVHGCPIISTEPSIELEELHHGENIYLVAPAAPEVMAEAVRILQSDDALRRKLATGATALARSFSWDVIAQKSLELFESLQ
jgi:glycosyltransferase involved in cell wall biosynthesis